MKIIEKSETVNAYVTGKIFTKLKHIFKRDGKYNTHFEIEQSHM